MKSKVKRFIRGLLPRYVSRRIYRWWADRYLDSLQPEWDPNKKTLLLLNHFWDQDIRALSQANRDYNLIVVESPILFKGAKIFFSDDVIDIRVAYDSEPIENRRLYYEECRRIFNRLHNRYHLDAIVTANDNYYWVREFIHVAHDYGVPTVILDKEGFITPDKFATEAERIKQLCPFLCDHVYVWSERQRTYWQKVGVANENISVIGQPRSDLFRVEKRHDVDNLFQTIKPIVTLFSYHDDVCIPSEVIQRENLTWAEMRDRTHDEFYELAREYPDYNFVIKTHPQQLDLAFLQSKYRLDNLRVIGGSATGNELIQRSELVVAFQTTVIIEAMFLNKCIVYTFWDKLIPRFQDDLYPFHKADGIVLVDSPDKFRQVCRRFLDGDRSDFNFDDAQLRARDEFVNTYLRKPDGRVCERFFASIDELVT